MAPIRRAGTLANVTTDSSGAISILIPATAVVGDIALITTRSTSTAAISGWTKVPYVGSYLTAATFWKVIAAGDPGSTVKISLGMLQGYGVPVSVEVWSAALSPGVTFADTAGVWPSVSAASGSIPLYVGYGYDVTSPPAPPASITPPAGLGGSYTTSTGSAGINVGLGAWFDNPTTGTTAPGYTFGFTAAKALLGVIILPPAVTNNAYIAGSTSAGDVLCSVVLAGSTSSADTTLLWTP